MSQQALDDDIEATSDRAPHGPKGADLLAILAISTFLGAMAFITLLITSATPG